MAQTAFCPRCGTSVALPDVAPGAWTSCPRCETTLRVPTLDVPGAEPPEVEAARRDPAARFGSFVLLEELGRGGMGVVHRAWHEGLKRVVALKTLLEAGGRDVGARFQREAEAVARLRHPAIVSVHEIGEVDGRRFIAMDFVRGRTLAACATGEGKIPLVRSLEALRDVARAVQHAHERGVVHRDLKPQNIVIDDAGRPFVLDFGLARVRAPGAGALTQAGAILGTPAYMAPEQAAGTGADERSDVWALGATLYYVLAGRPPFEGATEYNVLTAVLVKDPVPPSSWNPRAAGDLEAIALHCLEKDPSRRYESAGAFADDLDRHLAGDPIVARPIGVLERLVRRARRHRLATAGALALATVLLGLAGVAIAEATRASHENARARAEEARRVAAEKKADAAARGEAARTRRMLARALAERADRAVADGRFREASVFAAKALSLEDRDEYRALAYTARQGPWRRPSKVAAHEGAVLALAFDGSGKRVASAGVDRKVRLLDAENARALASFDVAATPRGVAFRPDGLALAAGGIDGAVRFFDLASGRETARLESDHHLSAVAWSTDGSLVAAGADDGSVLVWDLGAGRLLGTIRAHEGGVTSIGFCPGGTHVATGGRDAAARLFVARTGELVGTYAHEHPVNGVAISPDDRCLASAYRGGARITYFADASGPVPLPMLGVDVDAVAFGPGSRWLAMAARSVSLWDIPNMRTFAVLDDPGLTAKVVAVSASGASLAAGGSDGAVRVFDLSAGEARPWPASERGVKAVGVSPDGRLVLAGGFDGAVRLFDRRGALKRELKGHGAQVLSAAFSPDGRRIASASIDGTLKVWEAETGRESASLVGHRSAVTGVAWSRDGRALATTSLDRTVLLWNPDGGGALASSPAPEYPVGIAFLADGRRVAVASGDGRVHLVEPGARGEVEARACFREAAWSVALSPDGATLAVTSLEGRVALLPVAGGAPRRVEGHADSAWAVSWSPDGKALATGGSDRTLRVLDATTGRARAVLRGHLDAVQAVAWTPDGGDLVTGSLDGTVRTWPLREAFRAPEPLEAVEREAGLRVPDDPDGGALDPVPVDAR